RAMTREERLEHIWSATEDGYRGYEDESAFGRQHDPRMVMMCASWGTRAFKRLDELSDVDISAKLPVQLRYLPDAIAA
ncbi:hypothetical protein, partial [Staphylococcus aureus]